jgi:hypothetical protein
MKNLTPVLFLTLVSACSTGGGGTVLPSPSGDAALGKACRDAQPDIIPTTPILAKSILFNEGMGSAADSLELLRMGFERASFTVTPTNLEEASRLAQGDTTRWSRAPLTITAGTITLEVAQKGDARCAAFEREVESQKNSSDPKAATDDPMKYWTDTRFPPATAEGRNWCIATLEAPDPEALKLTRTVTSSQEGGSNVSVRLETLSNARGSLLARRTQVWMNRPSFPIGISSVATGCDGRTIGQVPEFFGPVGIAVRAAAPPTLINK